ncbi:hypothetical protein L3Y34_008981 [Caenorhabditis briggsae]|uniref:Uncharacterized protein n=1 Tax=Caenorhabditis briggsae TaxID=6238 RepID=A0AAE9AB51_CAEBR|nr:hypothetical protein L3Y34_008981 [Caenorhabditis briggsae]
MLFSFLFISFFSLLSVVMTKTQYWCHGDGILNNQHTCRFFTIVIDAGSTGTRLHLYKFIHDPATAAHGMPFKVEKEIFQEVKPGLSSFAKSPIGAADSLEPLLQRARKEVPHFMWEKTPITLKATAGLRLLPGDMADDILEKVEERIFNSGFFAAFPDAVNVMPGSDEGVYSWFTLNILLETLFTDEPTIGNKPAAHRSVAAFDLGGGSTQLTYWPNNEAVFSEHVGYERDIDFFGHHIRLFTHSFLGNGLIAARLNILQLETENDIETTHQLITSCMPEGFQLTEWEYALKFWNINGSSSYSYDTCYDVTKRFVESSEIMHLRELKGAPVYLFSYFFDRGLNSGLVKGNDGGQIELRQFKEAAKTACQRGKLEINDGSHWMPWQCLDLTYIYSLLRDGYQFEDNQPIVLAKKIKGMEVSWGQGLAFATANEFQLTEGAIKTASSSEQNATVVDQIVDLVYSGTNQNRENGRYDPSDTVSTIDSDEENFIIALLNDQKIDLMEKIEKSRGVNQGAKFPSIGGQSSKDALNLEVGLENPPEDIITSDDQEEDPFEIEVRLMLDEDEEDEEFLVYMKEMMSGTVECVAANKDEPTSLIDDFDDDDYEEK